jgi:RNA polymerase sigma-70 factor (ECF subfamily)
MQGNEPAITPTPDNLYLARMLNGCQRSWERLYERYRSPLLRFCGNFTSDPETAEAWMHETFLQLKSKAATFQPNAELKPWLYMVARNVCLQDLRRKREVAWSDSVAARNPLAAVDSNPTPASRAAAADLSERAVQVLDQLSEEERTVVLLKFVEGLTRKEIAAAMETPEATVKSRLHRAMKILRDKIDSREVQ